MTRFADDDVLDDGLDAMKAAVNTANGTLVVCAGQPADYYQASHDVGDGNGVVLATGTNPVLTIGDGASGRVCTVSAANGLSINANGNADPLQPNE